MHFQRSKKEKKNFQAILDGIFVDFFTFLASFVVTTRELDYCHLKMNEQVTSRVAVQL